MNSQTLLSLHPGAFAVLKSGFTFPAQVRIVGNLKQNKVGTK